MSRRLGPYQLTRQIGSGGMGEVWTAVKLGVGDVAMPCAIKLMRPELAQTQADRERFLNEARIAAQLDHGRIVKVIDVGESAGQLYLVMDRVDGVDLRGLLERFRDAGGQRLPLHISTFIVAEILAALSFAHNRTISGRPAAVIHHDVTPGNILISSSGEVKLTDFGIAKFAATAGWVSRPIGTLRYMAPEQLMGYYARPESDVYALGVVLHELLEGKRYLGQHNAEEFKRQVLSGPPPPLERDDVPQWLDQLRVGMLANEATQRPSSRAALQMILRNSSALASAGEELRQLYEQVVGDSRSGFTEFLEAVRDDPSAPMIVPGLARAPSQSASDGAAEASGAPTWWGSSAEEPISRGRPTESLPQTELLPPAFDEVPAPTSPTAPISVTQASVTGSVIAAPARLPGAPTRGSRLVWLSAALLGLVVLLGGAALVWIFDEPEHEHEVAVGDPALEQPAVVAEAPVEANEVSPTVASEPAVEPKPASVPEPPLEPSPQPTIEPEPPVEPEPTAEPKPEPEPPREASTPKPKPAPAPKMSVILAIDKVKTGQIKLRSKVHAHNGMTMLWLAPGRYPLSWRRTDKDPWTSAGTLEIADIGTDSYSVTLREGSHSRERVRRNK